MDRRIGRVVVMVVFVAWPVGVNTAKQDELYQDVDTSDWVDPTDMLNYDTGTQSMRKQKVGAVG